MKPVKDTKRSERLTFAILVLIGLGLLLLPHRLTRGLQVAFFRCAGGPFKTVRVMSLSSSQHTALDVVDRKQYQDVIKENRQLHNQLANLNEQLVRFHETVNTLQGIRSDPAWQRIGLIQADAVVASSSHTLIINRGKRDHVRTGQFVVCHNAVIGRILEVSTSQAIVQLITAPDSRLPVSVYNAETTHRSIGIMVTHKNGQIKLPLISRKYIFQVGDPVCINPQPGVLEVPIIVGRIQDIDVDTKNALLWDMTIEPACDTAAITEVHVLIAQPPDTQPDERGQ